MEESFIMDWSNLKRLAKEFFEMLPTSTESQASAGFKCLALSYFGMHGSELEDYQARLMLQIAAKEMSKYKFNFNSYGVI